MRKVARFTVEEFWRLVDKNSDGVDGCWIWLGSKSAKGYGMCYGGALFEWNNVAHRVSWYLVNGSIPKKMLVCHKCDNPSCVKPDHLFLGTSKDNMLDMHMKGRAGWQNRPRKSFSLRRSADEDYRTFLTARIEARKAARLARRKCKVLIQTPK